MSTEQLGPFAVYAEGLLLPAESAANAAGLGNANTAQAVPSRIITAASTATPEAGLTLAKAYYAAVGDVLTFRGVRCFVADVSVTQQAAKTSAGGQSTVVAIWTLLADLGWTP